MSNAKEVAKDQINHPTENAEPAPVAPSDVKKDEAKTVDDFFAQMETMSETEMANIIAGMKSSSSLSSHKDDTKSIESAAAKSVNKGKDLFDEKNKKGEKGGKQKKKKDILQEAILLDPALHVKIKELEKSRQNLRDRMNCRTPQQRHEQRINEYKKKAQSMEELTELLGNAGQTQTREKLISIFGAKEAEKIIQQSKEKKRLEKAKKKEQAQTQVREGGAAAAPAPTTSSTFAQQQTMFKGADEAFELAKLKLQKMGKLKKKLIAPPASESVRPVNNVAPIKTLVSVVADVKTTDIVPSIDALSTVKTTATATATTTEQKTGQDDTKTKDTKPKEKTQRQQKKHARRKALREERLQPNGDVPMVLASATAGPASDSVLAAATTTIATATKNTAKVAATTE